MKRSELHVGDELYYAKPTEWKDGYAGQRAVVLAVEPYERHQWSGRMRPTDKGVGVKVRLHRSDEPDGSGYGTVVPLGYLRGPWDELAAKVKAEATERLAAQREARERRKALAARREALCEQLRALGCTPGSAESEFRSGEISLSLDDVQRLLERLVS